MTVSPSRTFCRIAAVAVLAANLLSSGLAAAEGSRSLYPSTYNPAGARANLDLLGSLANPCVACYANVIRRHTFLYVYARAGEYVLLGSRSRNTGGDVFVYDPQNFGTRGNETRPAVANFTCSAAGGGFIPDRARELAGPNSADSTTTVPSGYAACAYHAPVTGIYGVQFTPTPIGTATPDGIIDPPDDNSQSISAWDVTVRATAASIADLDGRLFTYAWVANAGGGRRLYSTLYYVTADGYRYKQVLRGLDPAGFTLYGNLAGFLDNGDPLYKDVRGANQLVATFPVGITSQNAQFPIFFSDATPGGPNETEIARVLGALGVASVPPVPEVSNVSFQGNTGGSQSSVGAGGNFLFTSTNTLTFQIVVSADNVDFDPATPANRVLTGFAFSGVHSVYWNGKNNAGSNFAANTIGLPNYQFRLTGRNGEIHFPIIDAEGNLDGGPSIFKLNGTVGTTVFYDDRGYVTANGFAVGTNNGFLCGAATPVPPTPNVALLGVDSDATTFGGRYYRQWPDNGNSNADCTPATDGFGDTKGLNTWAIESTVALGSVLTIVAPLAAVDVGVGMTVPATALPGATVNGTLVFRNDGTSTATGVTYTSTLGTAGHFPTSATFATLPGTTYNPANGVVTFAGLPATLTAGQSISITFNYTAPIVPGIVTAAASIAADNESGTAVSANVANGNTDILSTQANLGMVKAGPATVGASSSFAYTLTVTNSGPGTAINAVVSDPAVANFTVSGVACGSESGGAVCPTSPTPAQLQSGLVVPTLPSGSSLVITVTGTAAATGAISNTASVSPPAGITDPVPGNDSSTAATTIVVGPVAVDDPDTTPANTPLNHATSILSNDSGTGIVVLSVTGSGAACTVFPCIIVTAHGIAVVQSTGTYTYAPTTGYSGPDGFVYQIQDTLGQTANAAVVLAVTPTAAADSGSDVVDGAGGTSGVNLLANDVGTSLVLSAFGGCSAFQCTVTVLDAGSATLGSVVVQSNGSYVYTATAVGTSVAIAYTVKDASNQTVISTLILTSTAPIPTADLTITKTVDVATPNVGGVVNFTVTAINNGPDIAVGAQVNDLLPAGYVLDSATASTGVYIPGTGVWTIGALANGASATLVIAAPVQASGPYLNTATVSATTIDPVPGNNSASVSTAPVAQADLQVAKIVSNGTPNVGSTVTFTVTVTNNGPSSAVGAQVNDLLPAGYVLVSATPSLGSYAPGTGVWTIGALANGASATLAIVATLQASGPYVNSAVVSATTGDSAPGNNSASIGVAPVAVASLAVSKTDNSATYTPGGSGTYVVVVTNAGPSSAAAVVVSDTLPAGVTLSGTVTCVAAGTATCGSVTGTAAQGSFGATGATIGAGSSLTLTVPVAFASNMTTATLINTVTASDPASPIATGSDSSDRSASVALAVSKTDGSATYTPGGTATYVVTVTNAGPSDAANVSLTETLPAGVTLTANAGCVANGVATCGVVTGVNGGTSFGTTGATLGAGAGDSLVFTVAVSFAAGMIADPLVNTATATDIATGATASGSDSDTLSAQVTLAVFKTDGSNTYTPGGTATYSVTITNGGLSTANNVAVADALPAGVSLSGPVTCVAGGTSNCGAISGIAGSTTFGATGALVPPGAGNTLVYTLPVVFATGMSADPLVNTAFATDVPSGATGSGFDSDARAAQVTLVVGKTDNTATYTPGGTGTYVVTIRDSGTSDALSVTANDALPAGVVLTGTVTCVANGIATCGMVTGTAGQSTFGTTDAGIGAGAGNTLVFTAPVAFAATLADDPLVNTATASDSLSLATASGSDSDARSSQALLAVTKTDNSTTYTPGGTGTYSIVVTNGGPSAALAVTVSDGLPSGVTLSGIATCVSAGAATCGTVTGTAGQSSVGATGATIGAGAGNALTITAPVVFAAGMTVNPLVNSVSVAEGALPPVSASDSDTLSAQISLAVIKTDGSATYTPGGTAIYTIVASNTGISDAVDVTLNDSLPLGVTLAGSVSCVANGTSNCGTVTGTFGQSTSGATGARISAGPANTLVFSAPVMFGVGMTVDPLVNVVLVTDVASGVSGSASDSNARVAGGSLAKTIVPSTIASGGAATLTLTLGNPNSTPLALFAAFTDIMPIGVITASGNLGTCPGVSVTATQITMAAGSAIPPGGCTIVVTITSSTPGTVTNTTGTLQTVGGSAPPASAPMTVGQPASLTADLSITKTNNGTQVSPGSLVTYTIVVTNLGPAAVAGATVTDSVPSVLTGVTWTCVASAGGSCPASGSGNLGVMVNLTPGGTATFTLTGTLSTSATGALINVATIAPPPGVTDPVPGNNAATDSDPISVSSVDLSIANVHLGAFAPGQIGAHYQITVTNIGTASSSGTVTVTDILPAGLTATAMAGAGWTCVQAAGPCSRSDPLAPGTSYPVITLTVSVALSPPSTLLNVASVTGGSDTNGANNAATDAIHFTAVGVLAEPIPTGTPATLLLLAALLALWGGWQVRKSQR